MHQRFVSGGGHSDQRAESSDILTALNDFEGINGFCCCAEQIMARLYKTIQF